MRTIKTILVDDHRVVLDGLNSVLADEKDIEVMDTAPSGELLLAKLKVVQPDVVVVDYSLTNRNNPNAINGFEAAQNVLRNYPDIKVLMLTMHNIADVIVPCVEQGIHGYMLKSERNFDISEAIRQVYFSGHYFSPEVAAQLALNMRRFKANHIEITSREQEVLESIFKGGTTKEIADNLFISTNTVETHRKNLMSKFEAKNSMHMVYIALQKGYLKLT